MEDIELPERFSSVKLVKASTGELFDIEFAQRLNDSSWVKPATAEMSDIELPPSRSFVSLVKSDMLLLSSPRLSLVKPARGEMSEMLLPLTHSAVRLVKPVKAEISEITLLAANPKCVSLVKASTGEMSDTELFQKSRYVRLVACSNPVRLRTPASGSSRRVKAAISDGVIGSPSALPRAVSTAARRLGSGMFTAASVTALKIAVCPIPAADTSTAFVPRFTPSVSVLCAEPFYPSWHVWY